MLRIRFYHANAFIYVDRCIRLSVFIFLCGLNCNLGLKYQLQLYRAGPVVGFFFGFRHFGRLLVDGLVVPRNVRTYDPLLCLGQFLYGG